MLTGSMIPGMRDTYSRITLLLAHVEVIHSRYVSTNWRGIRAEMCLSTD